MSQRVFVDTSAWIAVADRSEVRHDQALARYKQMLGEQTLLVTTSMVLAETHILLRRRIGYQAAMQFLDSANHSPRIEIIFPTLDHEQQARRILQQYQDWDFSLTDAISFACMQQAGLDQAFTYDRHFATAGFTCLN